MESQRCCSLRVRKNPMNCKPRSWQTQYTGVSGTKDDVSRCLSKYYGKLSLSFPSPNCLPSSHIASYKGGDIQSRHISSWGKTSQTGQVCESLNSTWKLCAVGHGSHSPRAAPEHVRQAGAKPDVEITQRISRLVVKEGRRVARWFLGNFRLCRWLVLSF